MGANCKCTIRLDDREIEIPAGTNLLAGALEAGAYVPHLCFHRDLPPAREARPLMIALSRAVAVKPGRTLFTVMPNGASSAAIVFAQFATAPRIVFESPRFLIGVTTDVEMMLTMRPYFASRMPGATACTSTWLHRTCCTNASMYACGIASNAGPAGGPPLLLIRMCARQRQIRSR